MKTWTIWTSCLLFLSACAHSAAKPEAAQAAPADRSAVLKVLSVAQPGDCYQDTQCAPVQACVAGRCSGAVPIEAARSVAPVVPVAAVAEPGTCAQDGECAPGQRCAEGRCVAAPAPEPAPLAVAPVAEPGACSQDSQCGPEQKCVEGRCAGAGLPQCERVRVHFSSSRARLQPRELPLLQAMARCLKAAPAARVVIEGNADERGAAKVNVALAERRAKVVEAYLKRLGVPASQIQAVSYGEEQPVCASHHETCWSENRRAEVKTVEGETANRR